MSETPTDKSKEELDQPKIEEVAHQNYSETSAEISKLYKAAPRTYGNGPSHSHRRELPGGVRVAQDEGYYTPGTQTATSRVSDGEGTNVETLYSINPLQQRKEVLAETSHNNESGQEVKYTGLTSRHKIKSEVTRGEYKHEFNSPEAASLITKLAINRAKKIVEEGKRPEDEHQRAA